MEETMNQLIAEVQRRRTDQQTQAGVIANLRQELSTAQASRGNAGGSQKMDPLKLGKPPMFAEMKQSLRTGHSSSKPL
eukprot:5388004-Amphidinium_carterae.1